MLLVKIVLILVLIFVFLQDSKDQQVYWFLFPIIGILGGLLFFQNTLAELFYISIILNITFVCLLSFVLYLYTKFKLKATFLDAIGLGDLCLFLVSCVAFSSISFFIIFICSLIFSLGTHLVLNRNKKNKTVPLAGYMSLFFCFVFIGYWTGIIDSIYKI